MRRERREVYIIIRVREEIGQGEGVLGVVLEKSEIEERVEGQEGHNDKSCVENPRMLSIS